MELHPVDPTALRWSSSSFLTPITRSKKVLNEQKHEKWRRPPWFCSAAEKIAEKVSKGFQKASNKELSRILRTEAAIKAIERKASSKKYKNLRPKAVLEALDEAIKGSRWESALKARVKMLLFTRLDMVTIDQYDLDSNDHSISKFPPFNLLMKSYWLRSLWHGVKPCGYGYLRRGLRDYQECHSSLNSLFVK